MENSGIHVFNVSDTFREELNKKRHVLGTKIVNRRKKVNVPPGQGITYDNLATTLQPTNQRKSKKIPLKSGDYVVVKYKNKVYSGQMLADFDEIYDALVSAISKKGKYWVWPQRSDDLYYNKKKCSEDSPTKVLRNCLFVQVNIFYV